METILAICLGIGLSASCGFRVFMPMLITGIAANAGHIELAGGFEWIGTPEAIGVFAVASVLEIGAYYFPWIDNLLDTAATPAAIVAGVIVSASVYTDMSPLMQWTLAAVLGGGAAGTVQGATVMLRGTSTATTGGLGNPAVSTGETAGSMAMSLTALLAPAAAAILFVAFIFMAVRWIKRRRRRYRHVA